MSTTLILWTFALCDWYSEWLVGWTGILVSALVDRALIIVVSFKSWCDTFILACEWHWDTVRNRAAALILAFYSNFTWFAGNIDSGASLVDLLEFTWAAHIVVIENTIGGYLESLTVWIIIWCLNSWTFVFSRWRHTWLALVAIIITAFGAWGHRDFVFILGTCSRWCICDTWESFFVNTAFATIRNARVSYAWL